MQVLLNVAGDVQVYARKQGLVSDLLEGFWKSYGEQFMDWLHVGFE